MGDVAMTVPVLRAFVSQYPEVKITVVSRPFFKPFFDAIPNVSFFGIDVNNRHKGFLGLIKLFLDLKKLSIDAVADLHNVIRSKAIRKLFLLSGKKVAASNKGRADKKALTRAENKIFKPLKTMFNVHCDTFKELGFDINLSSRNFGTTFPNKAILSEKIISITGNKNKKWIGIAPFAQYESKVYPLDLMLETINDLSKNIDCKILLFGGGEKEIKLLNSLSENNENVINVAGKITFQEELDLISNLDIMLSMDSGNAHIAAMLGIKVISLWGATHPFAGFSPFNQPLENALVSDREKYPLLPTSVYGNKIVSGYENVMRTILPETILNKIQKELN